MADNKKAFNTKIYAVIVFFLMAGFLSGVTVGAYTNKYNGFKPEKVAKAYVESIVNRGDGYNAYKNSLISKNFKYGDFIREYYMYPVIYRDTDYKPLDDRSDLKGYNDDSFKGEMTLTDTGSLTGQVIDTMYSYYEKLIKDNSGWDNYDLIFTSYFNKLVDVREEIFGDKYITDEIMFTALESNVSAYGDKLTGTDEVIDENTGVKLSEKTIGEYEKAFGKDYKLECKVKDVIKVKDLNEYKKNIDKNKLEKYGISIDDITDAATCILFIETNVAGTGTDHIFVHVVKINSTWYVDNTKTYIPQLYDFWIEK